MATKVRQIAIQENAELRRRASISLTLREKRMPGYTKEIDFDTSTLDEPASKSTKQIKKENQQLRSYLNDKSVKLNRISSKGDESVYKLKSDVDELNKLLKQRNKYRKQLTDMFDDTSYTIRTKGKDGVIREKKVSSKHILNAPELSVENLKLPSGKVIGGKTNTTANISLKGARLSAWFDETLGRMKGSSFESKRLKNLKKNYIKSLKNKMGKYFAKEVEKAISEISDAEFMYLFYTDEAFEFNFVYSQSDVELKMESIKSAVQSLDEKKKELEKFKDKFEKLGEVKASKKIKKSYKNKQKENKE